ncbi:hypothetical protein DTO013E5_3575 [Penicillium roqueforti]|nr:hypothetical protein DTO012A8_10253 [Penicillium roqueforti]KAI2742497.1 hypothetical protein DTO012A1_3798 [Penicillium roqueforti]KAI3133605.1 hypothetical protein CBS147326_4717 [Penicillium roqueforti]KAI3213662.1 hypothetical protein DTO013E5_3575 [Penicillium roqueforti]
MGRPSHSLGIWSAFPCNLCGPTLDDHHLEYQPTYTNHPFVGPFQQSFQKLKLKISTRLKSSIARIASKTSIQ